MKGTHRRPVRPSTGRSVASSTSSNSGPRRNRADRAHELARDYVRAIADLIQTEGEARVTDLADRLCVTHVTVGRTIQRLQRDGWVTSQPYRSIFLTDEGRQLAEDSSRRHRVVVDFLKSLGVPEDIAESDAAGIQHHVSPETLEALCVYLGRPSP
jgi:DtxR family manganese transport transcriptional regulator